MFRYLIIYGVGLVLAALFYISVIAAGVYIYKALMLG